MQLFKLNININTSGQKLIYFDLLKAPDKASKRIFNTLVWLEHEEWGIRMQQQVWKMIQNISGFMGNH